MIKALISIYVGMSQHESVKQIRHGSEKLMEGLLEIYQEYHGEELTRKYMTQMRFYFGAIFIQSWHINVRLCLFPI